MTQRTFVAKFCFQKIFRTVKRFFGWVRYRNDFAEHAFDGGFS